MGTEECVTNQEIRNERKNKFIYGNRRMRYESGDS